MAGWETLTGAVVGVGVGEAASTAIEPVLEPQRQKALSDARAMVFDLGTLAELVAQGLLDRDAAHAEGLRNGFDPSRTDRAIQLALKAAPVAELLELWRRGKISEALVDHGLAKEQIEPQYWDPIKELFYGRLDPAIVATAIQRGIMRDPGFLPVGPPTTEGKVPAFPVSALDPIEEAKAQGIDFDRLFVETAIVGLPLSLQQAASAYFREIIELPDFQRAVSEGNTRNEWGDAALEQAREILTAGQYAELQLRGFYTEVERRANTAKHGMSGADSDLLYNVLGRSVSAHQVTTGLARGGTYPSKYADVPQPYRAAIQRSNIREEWVGLAYANRYSYPSGFQIRGEAQAERLTFDETQQILLEVGWSPKWAEHFATSWTGGTTAAVDPHVGKAQTQLWTRTHSSYLAGEIAEADARTALAAAGVAAGAVDDVLTVWNHERDLERKQLTPAQVKKAYTKGVTNAASGAVWTRDDALAALIGRGYSPADANTFLEL